MRGRARWAGAGRRRRVVVASVVAVTVVLAGGVSTLALAVRKAPATSAVMSDAARLVAALRVGPALPGSPATGMDVSWPQCPSGSGGYGLPMPGPNAAFAVLGVTAGRGFTTNPCLSAQVSWLRGRGVRSAAYLVPTYPLPDELRRHAPPAAGVSLKSRLYAVGKAQARDAVRSLRAAGLRSRSLWLDVEAVKGRPWSPRPAENAAFLRGVVAGVRAAGFTPGLYTNSSTWKHDVGGARMGLAEWRTVGNGSRAKALAGCRLPSLNGGRVALVQYWTKKLDQDVVCAPLARHVDRVQWFAVP